MKRLNEESYLEVVKNTQIIATDLIVEYKNMYLVGKRMNNPAKGLYFVPGCRMYKGETMEDCIVRTAKIETGLEISVKKVLNLGVYYHYYPNNFRNDDFETHYIVFPFLLKVNEEEKDIVCQKMFDQHTKVKWMTREDLIKSEKVHQNTKNYFIENASNAFINRFFIN